MPEINNSILFHSRQLHYQVIIYNYLLRSRGLLKYKKTGPNRYKVIFLYKSNTNKYMDLLDPNCLCCTSSKGYMCGFISINSFYDLLPLYII